MIILAAVLLADPTLPHQIVLRFTGQAIVVSCNCLRVRHDRGWHWQPLGSKTRWEPGEPAALWREHMAAVPGD